MPNDNLGVAHGKIRITYDDRGSAKANAAMAKMAAQMETMQRSMARLESHLGITDQKLKQTGSGFDKTSGASKKFSQSLDGNSRSAQKFHYEAQKLIDELKEIETNLHKAQGELGGYSAGQGAASVATSRSTRNINRQSAALQAAVEQFSGVQHSVNKMAGAMEESNKVLQDNTKHLRRAGEGATGYSLDLFGARKRIRSFINDVQETHGDLELLAKLYGTVRDRARSFASVIRVLNETGQNGKLTGNLLEQLNVYRSLTNAVARYASVTAKEYASLERSIATSLDHIIDKGRRWLHLPFKDEWRTGLRGTRSAVVLLGGSFNLLKNRVIGVDKAINNNSPRWLKLMSKLLTVSSAVGGAFLVLSRSAAPFRIIEQLSKTKVFDKIGQGTTFLSKQMSKLGDQTEKIFGKNYFAGFANDLGKVQGKIDKGLTMNRLSAIKFARSTKDMGNSLKSFKTEAGGFLSALGLITGGLLNLKNRFNWFFKLPKPLITAFLLTLSRGVPAAASVALKSLTLLSNAVAGAWGGVKQLSGGLIVLPGLLASVGAVASALGITFLGLKDKMKDLFSDDLSKSLAAYYGLPQVIRPAAKALLGFKDTFKKLQEVLQGEAFKGLEGQIEKVGKTYFPIVEKGARQVIVSLRGMKDEFVGFLMQQQTQNNTSAIYSSTAEAIRQIGHATQPALAGLQAMSVEGSRFIADMSGFAPVLANMFNVWSQKNAANGNMRQWMNDSVAGVYDLIRGFKSLGEGVYSVLTMFKTKSGNNGLEDFANTMDRLEIKMKESTITGFLASIRDGLKGALNSEKVKDLKDLVDKLGDAFHRSLPFINGLADTFSAKFIPMLETSAYVLSQFLVVLNALGANDIIGFIMGWAFAFKLLPKSVGAATDGIKVLIGTIWALWTKGKVFDMLSAGLNRVATAATYFGATGQKVGNGLQNITTAGTQLHSTLSKVGNVLAIAGTALTAFFALYSHRQQSIKAFDTQLKQNSTSLLDFRDSLYKAFTDDRGLRGSNVMSTVESGLNQMYQNIEATADKMPDFWDHFWDMFSRGKDKTFSMKNDFSFSGMFGNFYKESDAINKQQDVSEKFINAANGLKKLREAGVNISGIITGPDSEFAAFTETQKKLGKEGQAVIEVLNEQRNKYKQAEEAAKAAGPEQILLANGIKKIAEAGGDATSKLDGLKKIIDALTGNRASKLEALANYQQQVIDFKQKIGELVSEGGFSLSDILKDDGNFNFDTQKGIDFYNQFKDLADRFQAFATSSGDVDAAYKKFEEDIKGISEQTGIAIPELEKLGQEVGILPETTKLSLQLEGKGKVEQDLAQIYLTMKQMAANGVTTPVTALSESGKTGEINQEVDKALGPFKDFLDIKDGTFIIKPGVSNIELQKMEALLASKGIGVGANPVPDDKKAQLPVKPVIDPNVPGPLPGQAHSAPLNPGDNDYQLMFPGQQNPTNGLAEVMGAPVDEAVNGAEKQGEKFAENLTKGMEGKKGLLTEAAEKLADEIKGHFHNSPPKKGPLAAHGDAAVYAGQVFTKSLATGLTSGTSNVTRAASGVGSAAMSSTGLAGDKNYEAGKFLGQISSIVDFASHFADAMGKMAETVFGFAKFISDPMGKGTFFGNQRKWIPDPKLTGEALVTRQGDAIQNRISSMYSSANRDTSLYDDKTGMMKIVGPGKLQRNASKNDIVAAIVAQGQAAGLSQEQIVAAVAIARHESNFDPMIVGKGQGAFGAGPGGSKGDAYGLYQQTESWGTVEQRTDPNYAINKFLTEYQKTLAANPGIDPVAAASLTQNPQLGSSGVGGSEYNKKTESFVGEAAKEVEDALKSGVTIQTTTDRALPGIGISGLQPSSILKDTGPVPTNQAGQVLAALLQNRFPQLKEIGGSRMGGATPGTHTEGKSIDVEIPDWNSPQGKALGDEINAFIRANASQLGVEYTIWQDKWQDFKGNKPTNVPGHMNHIDVHFSDGATANIGPNGTNLNLPVGTGIKQDAFKFPSVLLGDEVAPTPDRKWIKNPDGTFTEVHGEQDGRSPGELNPKTGKPWTDQELIDLKNQYPMQYDLTGLRPGDLEAAGIYQGSQEQQLKAMKENNPLLAKAITVAQNLDGTSSQADTMTALDILTAARDQQLELKTPGGRQGASAIDSLISSAASDQGLVQEENPFDTAATIAGTATSIAGDIFQVINSAIDAIGATKNITSTLARGVSNSEQIFSMIDDFQKYIQLGADVAGAVSSITGAIGSIVGAGAGSDPSGGASGAAATIAAISQIAGLVQSGLDTVNAFIDLGQEAYRIIGSYAGDFLSQLFGGPEGALMGNIKFLLDERTNELLAYSADNPLDKRSHPTGVVNTDARRQGIGTVNMYGGPGTDPRDMTRQMMLQVKSSQLTGATNQ